VSGKEKRYGDKESANQHYAEHHKKTQHGLKGQDDTGVGELMGISKDAGRKK